MSVSRLAFNRKVRSKGLRFLLIRRMCDICTKIITLGSSFVAENGIRWNQPIYVAERLRYALVTLCFFTVERAERMLSRKKHFENVSLWPVRAIDTSFFACVCSELSRPG
jgi:hypothetical protein